MSDSEHDEDSVGVNEGDNEGEEDGENVGVPDIVKEGVCVCDNVGDGVGVAVPVDEHVYVGVGVDVLVEVNDLVCVAVGDEESVVEGVVVGDNEQLGVIEMDGEKDIVAEPVLVMVKLPVMEHVGVDVSVGL